MVTGHSELKVKLSVIVKAFPVSNQIFIKVYFNGNKIYEQTVPFSEMNRTTILIKL